MSTDSEASSNPRDRRHFSRVEFRHQLTLASSEGEYHGAFDDISLRGMLFWSDPLPEKGEEISGTLVLGDIEIRLAGVVVQSNLHRGAAI
ncbi:PilZ domain-containing protein, partial [Candidatus Magnetaquicoccus inordinatus]|uniref:PilZ domain-containing protein n=1 Tax=Candidatus Magnetaquicoccus inordinatus TaxID=2496818 RepID=UPI00102BAE94